MGLVKILRFLPAMVTGWIQVVEIPGEQTPRQTHGPELMSFIALHRGTLFMHMQSYERVLPARTLSSLDLIQNVHAP